MVVIDKFILINSSCSLQTSSKISFVIMLYLILQMWKDFISKNLKRQLNKTLIILLRRLPGNGTHLLHSSYLANLSGWCWCQPIKTATSYKLRCGRFTYTHLNQKLINLNIYSDDIDWFGGFGSTTPTQRIGYLRLVHECIYILILKQF